MTSKWDRADPSSSRALIRSASRPFISPSKATSDMGLPSIEMRSLRVVT